MVVVQTDRGAADRIHALDEERRSESASGQLAHDVGSVCPTGIRLLKEATAPPSRRSVETRPDPPHRFGSADGFRIAKSWI
jgi:hypothetical protein